MFTFPFSAPSADQFVTLHDRQVTGPGGMGPPRTWSGHGANRRLSRLLQAQLGNDAKVTIPTVHYYHTFSGSRERRDGSDAVRPPIRPTAARPARKSLDAADHASHMSCGQTGDPQDAHSLPSLVRRAACTQWYCGMAPGSALVQSLSRTALAASDCTRASWGFARLSIDEPYLRAGLEKATGVGIPPGPPPSFEVRTRPGSLDTIRPPARASHRSIVKTFFCAPQPADRLDQAVPPFRLSSSSTDRCGRGLSAGNDRSQIKHGFAKPCMNRPAPV